MSGPVVSPSDFEAHRAHLLALAYRMLGSVADAEDVVQEAWLRWERADRGAVAHPRAYLRRATTRLCLDHIKSARARRERYVGPWLPEPVLGEGALSVDAETELAEDVSYALLLALERLSPLERAAFLLREVFDTDYGQIADALGRSPAACRQLASRAKKTIRETRPRFEPVPDEHARLVMAFGLAVSQGDLAGLSNLLADDIVFYSDGGGRVKAALRPVRGVDPVARFVLGVARRFPLEEGTELTMDHVNGAPGIVLRLAGEAVQTLAFDIREGRIRAVYAMRNPEKLTHAGTSSDPLRD